MKKIYLVYEKKKIYETKNKKDAINECENQSLFYPENSYEIIEQEIKE